MTAAWWSGVATGLDFESDGPEPLNARIITANITTISAVGAGTTRYDWLVKPERPIPDGAIEIHHITTEEAQAKGTDRAEAIAHIARTLAGVAGGVIGGGCPVVGHNLRYDLTLLDREMRRTGVGSLAIASPGCIDWEPGTVIVQLDGRQIGAFYVIDTMVVDRAIDRYRPGSRKLVDTAAHYGVRMGEGGAHDAGADVLGCLRIAWRIAAVCGVVPYSSEVPDGVPGGTDWSLMTLPELHDAQVHEALGQARSLAAYFRKTGKTAEAATVRGEWPFIPYEN